MSDLRLAGLTKRYAAPAGEVDAVGGIDIEVADGEVLALVGPSGCGKSTVLRTIAGLVRPTEGEVEVGGRPVWPGERADRSALAQVSMVFQEANLLPWSSVAANVALPLRARGVPKKERLARAEELCALTGIGDFARHRPAALSIGMRHRAALARALVAEPGVLLLDEPFAALDALTRDAMNHELQRIWASYPCTVVLVTHSIPEAVLLADRVVTMSARPGRVASVVEVPFTRPRRPELTHTREFQDLVRRLRTALVEAWG